MELRGPVPKTPEEYLILIYAAVQESRADRALLNSRLAAIEQWVWYMRGIGAILGITAATLVGHIIHVV